MGKIIVGKWEAELQKNGSYSYKVSDEVTPLPSIRPKPIYKERPQFSLIEKYESVAKEQYKKDLYHTAIKIAEFIKTL